VFDQHRRRRSDDIRGLPEDNPKRSAMGVGMDLSLRGLAVQAIGKLPDGCEIALLRQDGQLLRNSAEPKWIAPESNPKRVVEWLFPVRAADRPSHDALRICFIIDMNLHLIHGWNYGQAMVKYLHGNDEGKQIAQLKRIKRRDKNSA